MRPSSRLLAAIPRITFFTSPKCSLCDTAKTVVQKVKTRRDFELVTIDVREEGQQQWFDRYAFDTPVIHVDRTTVSVKDTLASQKLMHRFTENQVEELLDNVEASEIGEKPATPPPMTFKHRLQQLTFQFKPSPSYLSTTYLASLRDIRYTILGIKTQLKMQAANRIHNAMKKGTSFGAWQMLAGTNLARTLTSSGVDWVLVDCEHGNIADSQMHEAVTAIAAQSVSPLVRIPANQDWMVKRVLDAGAHGVMVPLLETADEARQLVRNAKFPPRGRRGFGSPFPMQTFKDVNSAGQYLQEANDSLLTIVQIETKQALANVDEIAAVDGIDCLFVGPFDLGINIGHPITTSMPEELRTAIEKVNKAAHAKGKKSGMFCTSGAQAREFADQGFDMISITTDVAALQNYVENEFNAAKGSIAHSAFQMAKGAAQKVSGPYGR